MTYLIQKLIFIATVFTSLFCSCTNRNNEKDINRTISPCGDIRKTDSAQLLDFSKKINIAMLKRSMEDVSDFFAFPFLYSDCIVDTIKNISTVSITKDRFIASKMTDYFGVWFGEYFSKGYIYPLLDIDSTENRCRLIFEVPYASYRQKSNCASLYFTIEKVNGEYKFTSAWLGRENEFYKAP